jgi:sulfonate transport system substrate-binding protein
MHRHVSSTTGPIAHTAAPNAQRRRLLLGMAAAGLGGVAIAAPATTDLGDVTLRVATYKGLWRPLLAASGQDETPYRIEWRELNSGVLHIEAIHADALDVGSGSEIPPVFAARGGHVNVRLIARIREDLNNQVTLARRGSGIGHIADLKGRRVGYVRATTAHYFLSKQLTEAGLSFADIDAINLTPADGLSAFDRGEIDAWAIYGYNGQIARTRLGARVLKTGKGYLSGNFPIYANPRTLDDARRSAAVADFLLRLRRAYQWANANYPAYAKAQHAETRVPLADLLDMHANRSDDFAVLPVAPEVLAGHQDVADTFLKLGVLDAPVDVRPLWDTRFNALLADANA